MISAPSRPVMRYHGGKWRIAPWIIRHFPEHRTYTEVFGGAASVLLRKPPANVEVYNDLNQEIVGAFRVLRDPDQAKRLAELLRATPCSEVEFRECYAPSDDPVEQARRTIVRGMQGHGSTGCSGGKKTGWRRGVRPRGKASSADWSGIWEHVADWADRMRGVFLECRPADEVLKRWDRPDALHYVDPPYPASTRTSQSGVDGYAHEMDDGAHAALSIVLRAMRGTVILSGYACPLYTELFGDWHRVDRPALADHGAARVECLWSNRPLTERQETAA